MRLLTLLLALGFATAAQAADPWPGGKATTACSQSSFAYNPDDADGVGSYTGTQSMTLTTSAALVVTDDDCGDGSDLTCFRENQTFESGVQVGEVDVLGEWGECDGNDTTMLMQWDRTGGGTAQFQVDCDLSMQPQVANRFVDLRLHYGDTNSVGTGAFASTRQHFSDGGLGTGTESISLSGAVNLTSGDCIGVRADRAISAGDFDVLLKGASCSVREISACTTAVP